MLRNIRIVAVLYVATATHGIAAQEKSTLPSPPAVFQAVMDCSIIENAEERLRCYDVNIPLLRAASQREDIVIADREQVREAKRGLFGITLPELKLFSRDKEDEINEIESTLASVSSAVGGKWILRLEDGASWIQTDTRRIRPQPGDSVKIRRAAMGSFLANIDGGIAIRVRRIN